MVSKNMERVKKDILEEMESTPYVSGDAWADILLRNAKYCKTEEDQQDFWRFILNPSDSREFKDPTFVKMEEAKMCDAETTAEGSDVYNEFEQIGGTMFVRTKPITVANVIETCMDDEKEPLETIEDIPLTPPPEAIELVD